MTKMGYWVLGLVVVIGACDDGGGATATDTTAGDTTHDADTQPPPQDTTPDTTPADTAGPVDTTVTRPRDTHVAPDTAVSASCELGDSGCDGYLLLRCSAAGHFEVDRVCGVTCTESAGGGACTGACSSGEDLGCVNGTGRRCATEGDAGYAVACLGGCADDSAGCAPLGAAEWPLHTASGDLVTVTVATVGGAADGWMVFAWQGTTDDVVRAMLTDPDGNAVTLPAALPTGTSVRFTQLHVRGGADGSFVVMGLAPSGTPGLAETTLWGLSRSKTGPPTLSARLLANAATYRLPQLVVLSSMVAVFHLEDGTKPGETKVSRASWSQGTGPSNEAVDVSSLEHSDLVAAAVGADTAHVVRATETTVRLSVSTEDTPASDPVVVDRRDLLFAGVSGRDGASAVAAYDFTADPAAAIVARFDGAALGKWESVEAPLWFQATTTDSGIAALTLGSDGAVQYIDDVTAADPAPRAVYTPTAGGARDDIWIVYDAARERVRLVTLGTDASHDSPQLRISTP